MNIAYHEQRAKVSYWIEHYDGYIETREFTGWVMHSLQTNMVAARKIGGRNHFLLCHLNDIYKIEPALTKTGSAK